MMFNTVHGGMYQRNEPDIGDNSLDQDQQFPPQTGEISSNYHRVKLDSINKEKEPRNRRNRAHVKPEVGETQEPSLPQFPPSSLEVSTIGHQKVESPVMATSNIWKKSRTAARTTKAPYESYKKSEKNLGSNGILSNDVQKQNVSSSGQQYHSRKSSFKGNPRMTAFHGARRT